MSPSSPQHEPTMEEILASIRKIISEESPEGQSAAPPVQAKPVPEADVLELTEEVHDEPVQAAVSAAPQPEPAAETVVQLPSQEEPPVSSPAQVQSISSAEGIFSDKSRKALNDAFTSVEPEPEVKTAPASAAPVAPVDGATLETVFDRAIRETFDPVLHGWLEQNKDAIVERMKPVVTQWLDDHFPSMLEEAVREELSRVSKARVKR